MPRSVMSLTLGSEAVLVLTRIRAVLGKLAGLAVGAKGNGELYLGGSKMV